MEAAARAAMPLIGRQKNCRCLALALSSSLSQTPRSERQGRGSSLRAGGSAREKRNNEEKTHLRGLFFFEGMRKGTEVGAKGMGCKWRGLALLIPLISLDGGKEEELPSLFSSFSTSLCRFLLPGARATPHLPTHAQNIASLPLSYDDLA